MLYLSLQQTPVCQSQKNRKKKTCFSTHRSVSKNLFGTLADVEKGCKTPLSLTRSCTKVLREGRKAANLQLL
ncbi:MAG: hypothetical protein IJT03_03550 [Clostridia bacterium]|nr:hypothetical protein [Clostridia bacterium]